VPLVGDAIEDHVQLLGLGVVGVPGTLRKRLERREVQLGIFREDGVVSLRVGDVGVIAVSSGVNPEVVELRAR
jgi:hypothetical protein